MGCCYLGVWFWLIAFCRADLGNIEVRPSHPTHSHPHHEAKWYNNKERFFLERESAFPREEMQASVGMGNMTVEGGAKSGIDLEMEEEEERMHEFWMGGRLLASNPNPKTPQHHSNTRFFNCCLMLFFLVSNSTCHACVCDLFSAPP